MNRDEIIRMARDSGMELYGLGKNREKFIYHLKAFADLIADAEREACADICYHEMDNAMNLGMKVASGNCADKIRARSEL